MLRCPAANIAASTGMPTIPLCGVRIKMDSFTTVIFPRSRCCYQVPNAATTPVTPWLRNTISRPSKYGIRSRLAPAATDCLSRCDKPPFSVTAESRREAADHRPVLFTSVQPGRGSNKARFALGSSKVPGSCPPCAWFNKFGLDRNRSQVVVSGHCSVSV